KKVVCYGSLVRDIIYHVPHFVRPGETLPAEDRNVFYGGKGFNQSIALKRAGLADVYQAGSYGPDGLDFLEYLRKEKVATELVYPVAVPQGHAVIQITPDGQNAILHFGGSNRCVPEKLVGDLKNFLSEGDWFIAQNEVNLLPETMNELAEKGVVIAFNPSPCDDSIKSLPLEKTSYLIVNELEGATISGVPSDRPEEILNSMRVKFPNTKTILTLGENGAYYDDGKEAIRQEAYKVKAIDSVGAGDTFAGYFFASIINGLAPKDALMLASKAAAISVTRPGAAPSIPSLKEVLDYKF
ncbi:ribokinase, partial [bacterium]|nr:ribokinase [bacterium]